MSKMGVEYYGECLKCGRDNDIDNDIFSQDFGNSKSNSENNDGILLPSMQSLYVPCVGC